MTWQGKVDRGQRVKCKHTPVKLRVIVAFEFLIFGGAPRRGCLGSRTRRNSRSEDDKPEDR